MPIANFEENYSAKRCKIRSALHFGDVIASNRTLSYSSLAVAMCVKATRSRNARDLLFDRLLAGWLARSLNSLPKSSKVLREEGRKEKVDEQLKNPTYVGSVPSPV